MNDFTARPYQKYAIQEIINKPAVALMLDMGLGKTVITLTAVDKLLYDYFSVSKVLVIAPLMVAETTWVNEQKHWKHLKHLRISRVLGSLEQRLAALQEKADIFVINRENVTWLVDTLKSEWDFDMVVIDESSSFKNHKSKRFKALKKVRPFIQRIIELTGTPAPNGYMDLWSQIYLLDKGERLGTTIGAFKDNYFKPAQTNGYIVYSWALREGAAEVINRNISDICVSMKSEDYLQLPDIMYNVIKVKMPDEKYKKYKELERDCITELEHEQVITAQSAGTACNKLLQMANGFAYGEDGQANILHDEKIKALKELADTGNNLLVFYWFKQDRLSILKSIKYVRELQSSKDIEDWNNGKIKILLAQASSVAHGLNLQHGGHIIVWYSLTWSLEIYQQANKRLHRSGQAHNVIIHHLVTENTVDENVMQALRDKKVNQNAILEAVRAKIGK